MEKTFVYGIAVDDHNFTGRKEESRHLKRVFESGNNSILISPRRWGKTSLVNHVCRQIDSNEILIVKLDIFGCKNEYEFYNALAEAVLKQTASRVEQWMEEARDFLSRLTPKISLSPEPYSEISVSLGITPETHTPEQILNLAETIAVRKKKHIIICIDEFQQIGEFENTRSIQGNMRSVWQHQQNTSYCLYGSKRHMMSNIFLDKSMPFYQFGDLMWLKKIPADDWKDYIISRFNHTGIQVSEQMVEKICNAVDLYPSYVQQLAAIILERMRQQADEVTESVIAEALSDLVNANEPLFMQQIEPLSAYQMNLIRAIASGIHSGFNEQRVRKEFNLGSPSNLVRLRKALIEHDLIFSEMKQLYITDPIFALWFKRRFL